MMDEDLNQKSKDELIAEIINLRNGIREHKNSSGNDLCWFHPKLWSLLPEINNSEITVPKWPQFLRGCVKFRESLDKQLPDAPRSDEEFPGS